jgi:hypothetical protein
MSKEMEIFSPNGNKQELTRRVFTTIHFKSGHAPVLLTLDTPHEFMVPVVNNKGQITLVDVNGTTWVFNWVDILFIETQNKAAVH